MSSPTALFPTGAGIWTEDSGIKKKGLGGGGGKRCQEKAKGTPTLAGGPGALAESVPCAYPPVTTSLVYSLNKVTLVSCLSLRLLYEGGLTPGVATPVGWDSQGPCWGS